MKQTTTPHQKAVNAIHRSIENLRLNCEMTRAQVRGIANRATVAGVITPNEQADVVRVLADKSQCAEDALGELQDFVNASQPPAAPTLDAAHDALSDAIEGPGTAADIRAASVAVCLAMNATPAPLKTVSVTIQGEADAIAACAHIARSSQWFEFTPLPCDRYEITVKPENAHLLPWPGKPLPSADEVQLSAYLDALAAVGFIVATVDNGGGEVSTPTRAEALSEALATDEATLRFNAPDTDRRPFAFIVWGNSASELFSDFSLFLHNPTFAQTIERVADAFENA